MKARKITRNVIEKMGVPVYGFPYGWPASEEVRFDNFIGYNCGIHGWNYDVYLNTFANGEKYIIVTGYRVPNKWLKNVSNLMRDKFVRC